MTQHRLTEETGPVDRLVGDVAARIERSLRTTLELFKYAAAVLRAVGRLARARRFPWEEFLRQAWFVVHVSMLPALLVTVPFGVVIALQIGSVAQEVGAGSYMGAANSLAVLRQAAPLVTALLLAGAAGSAICSDLGARKVREELDALEVMAINPVERLAVPRIAACTVVGVLLQSLVCFSGLITSYVFSVLINHASTGAYFASMSSLAGVSDFLLGAAKAAVFGAVTGVVACYKGSTARGGPSGVADAVNQTAVATFLLLFAINLAATQLFLMIAPQRV